MKLRMSVLLAAALAAGGVYADDNFQSYADSTALKSVFTEFDINNPFPEQMQLITEADGKFVRFQSQSRNYAVIVYNFKVPPKQNISALSLKIRGNYANGDQPTISFNLRPGQVTADAMDKKVLLSKDWQTVTLDCPDMREWNDATLIISYHTDLAKFGELTFDIDDFKLGVSALLKDELEYESRALDNFAPENNPALTYSLPCDNLPLAKVTAATYDNYNAILLTPGTDTMVSAVGRKFNNPAKGSAAGIRLSAADVAQFSYAGVAEVAVRQTLDGPDLAMVKLNNLTRRLEEYTMLCPEIKDLDSFVLVFRTGRRDLQEHAYNHELYKFYGGQDVSDNIGHSMAAAITGLRVITLDEVVSVIPKPQQVTATNEVFTLSPRSAIVAGDAEKIQAETLRKILMPATGYALPVISADQAESFKTVITLELNPDKNDLGMEGYELSVKNNGIKLTALTENGLFYGIQTLRQLFPADIESRKLSRTLWRLPCVEIRDIPEYQWRGMHLDTARHFMSKEFIFKFIDMLAMMKMNRFHWHYNDGTAWRIEVKELPKLTEAGAWWGNEVGGYYTEEDVNEIVQYAHDRFITIMPEVEMPAHANAALFAYPEYSCQKHTQLEGDIDTPSYFLRPWGFSYCVGSEATYDFIEKLIAANVRMFPNSEFIHLGGDELPPGLWSACPVCKKFMEDNNFADEAQLQHYFTKRLEEIAAKYDRRVLGWEQIMNDDLGENTAVLAYLSSTMTATAAKAGHDVISNNAGSNYLDYYQGDPATEPIAITGITDLKQSYKFNPMESVPAELRSKVLGGQSALWTEYIPSELQAGYQLYPRSVAIAEKLWTPLDKCSWPNFKHRMNGFYRRLANMDVNYKDYREKK